MADNAQANCILQVCCLTRKRGARAMAHAMAQDPTLKADFADVLPYCEWVMNNYDLAPYLSLSQLKAEIVKHAQSAPYAEDADADL